jgi:hypothetical protein
MATSGNSGWFRRCSCARHRSGYTAQRQPHSVGCGVTASRPRLRLARRLIGWIAAYAFVLHAVFAGAIAAQLAVGAGAPGFEICLGDADGAPIPGHGQKSQHESCALHCVAFAGAAALVIALIALLFPLRNAPARWHSVFRPRIHFLCRAGNSRAPPLPA